MYQKDNKLKRVSSENRSFDYIILKKLYLFQFSTGDKLLVMIAMKMEYVIKSPKDGVIKKISHNAGETVSKGTVLVSFEE